ncbi:MAG: hypothetical protein ACXWM7_05640 [Parachlamydiaceae bacterium]
MFTFHSRTHQRPQGVHMNDLNNVSSPINHLNRSSSRINRDVSHSISKGFASDSALKIYQFVANFPWKAYLVIASVSWKTVSMIPYIDVLRQNSKTKIFSQLQKDLKDRRDALPTSLKSYHADKALAIPTWLAQHQQAIITHLKSRIKGESFSNDEVASWIGRIIDRLYYHPAEFAAGKIPSLNPETGELSFIDNGKRLDYDVKQQYLHMVYDYLLKCSEDPSKLEKLAINTLYENPENAPNPGVDPNPLAGVVKSFGKYLNMPSPTTMESYEADRVLATPEWLEENEEAIKTNLRLRQNEGPYPDNEASEWLTNIIMRLNYSPKFIRDKVPSLNSETGEISLIDREARWDYDVEKEYLQQVYSYLLQGCEDPSGLERLVINPLYESRLRTKCLFVIAGVISWACLPILFLI